MKTIVCIPGSWTSQTEFIQSIVKATDGRYLAAGAIMMQVDGPSIEFELCPHDERMRGSFAVGGREQVTAEELEAIAHHGMVLYLLTDEHGLDHLHKLHNFINVCLAAGGLGIKFENSGVAHTPRMWHGYTFHTNTLSLLEAHVMLVGEGESYFSCGMHIFGLPDAAVEMENKLARYLLTEFNHYHLFEGPVFKDGQTFSPDKDFARLRLSIRDDYIYKGEGCFENPFGRIELKREPSK